MPEMLPQPVHEVPDWEPGSWLARPAVQQPSYPDQAALHAALAEVASLPPLVTSLEILMLKRQLAECAEGKRFLLQGGDCAESFAECDSHTISNRLKVLLQMSVVLIHGLKLPVVRVGRFAGQYAKPRSADLETRDGVTLPSYRGDIVNDSEFTIEARTPDPRRLVRAHSLSAQSPPCSRKRRPSCASAICFLSARISQDVTSGGSRPSSRCTAASASASGYCGCWVAGCARQLPGLHPAGTETGWRLRSVALMSNLSLGRSFIISQRGLRPVHA
jgi:hypothetical protein